MYLCASVLARYLALKEAKIYESEHEERKVEVGKWPWLPPFPFPLKILKNERAAVEAVVD